jgi:hypothetical protein
MEQRSRRNNCGSTSSVISSDSRLSQEPEVGRQTEVKDAISGLLWNENQDSGSRKLNPNWTTDQPDMSPCPNVHLHLELCHMLHIELVRFLAVPTSNPVLFTRGRIGVAPGASVVMTTIGCDCEPISLPSSRCAGPASVPMPLKLTTSGDLKMAEPGWMLTTCKHSAELAIERRQLKRTNRPGGVRKHPAGDSGTLSQSHFFDREIGKF